MLYLLFKPLYSVVELILLLNLIIFFPFWLALVLGVVVTAICSYIQHRLGLLQ